MTAVARLDSYSRHYPASFGSSAVSDESFRVLKLVHERFDASVTRGVAKDGVLSRILEARAGANADGGNGDDGIPVSLATVEAAIKLLFAMPSELPTPEVAAEATGEISFEWYRDPRHVFVLSVEDSIIRWSGLLGSGTRVSGSEPFRGAMPVLAIEAIRRLNT